MEKKLFVFDVDGTLYNGHYLFPLADALLEENLLTQKQHAGIFAHRAKYLQKKATYATTLRNVFGEYEKAIKGISARKAGLLARHIVQKEKNHLFPGARQLIAAAGKRNWVIALSLSPIEAIRNLKMFLPFHATYGTVYETRNGKYIGRARWPILKTKKALIERMQKKFPARETILIGDTIEDFKTAQAEGFQFFGVHADFELQKAARQGKCRIFKDLKVLLRFLKENALV